MALVLELALDREEVVLGVVEQHDPVRLDARDLTAQLRADRAPGAGHEHGAPRQIGADALELHVHRLAAEHVLDAHLAHLARERAAGLQQLEHGRQRAHRDRARAALAHDPCARRAGGGRDRDDHFVGLGVVEHSRQVCLGVAAHTHAIDAQATLAGVVIEEAHRDQAELAVAQDLAHDHPPALAGAGDQHGALVLAPAAEGGERATLVDGAGDGAHAHEKHQREQREQHDHAVWEDDGDGAVVVRGHAADEHQRIAVHGPEHLDRDDAQQHDHEHRAHHRLVVALPCIAPAALVDAAEHEHRQAPERDPHDRLGAEVGVRPWRPAVEAQLERKVVRERDQRPVHYQLRQRVTVEG